MMNRMIRGGDGSHWPGCESVHWDCKIAMLEKRIADLLDKNISMSAYIKHSDEQIVSSNLSTARHCLELTKRIAELEEEHALTASAEKRVKELIEAWKHTLACRLEDFDSAYDNFNSVVYRIDKEITTKGAEG
jgi:hypothetical protein